jgi:hypothetical protein
MNAIKVPLLSIAVSQTDWNALGVIAVVCFVLGGGSYVFLQAPIWWDRWSKYRLLQQRRKQIMTDRERQLRELMTSIIGDGLLAQAADGKISDQEYKRLSHWAGEDLDLPDLIPTKDRVEQVKTQIRASLSRLKKVDPKLPDAKKLSLKK